MSISTLLNVDLVKDIVLEDGVRARVALTYQAIF